MKDKELFFNTQQEINSSTINKLKQENEILQENLNVQIKMYNKLLVDFSAQQKLLEEKSIKMNILLDKMNSMVEELNKVSIKEIQNNDLVINDEKDYKMNQNIIANHELIKNYQQNIDRLKTDNKLLVQENEKLRKENLIIIQQLTETKGVTSHNYSFNKNELDMQNKLQSLNYKYDSKGYTTNNTIPIRNYSNQHKFHKEMCENDTTFY